MKKKKKKKVGSLHVPSHKLLGKKLEAVDISISNNTFKITICVCQIWNHFLKIDILPITASLKFESKNPLHICDTQIVIICHTPYFVSI